MTIGLDRWLRLFAALLPPSPSARARMPRLDSLRLGERDLADLNLPDQVARRMRGRMAAEEFRRRVF